MSSPRVKCFRIKGNHDTLRELAQAYGEPDGICVEPEHLVLAYQNAIPLSSVLARGGTRCRVPHLMSSFQNVWRDDYLTPRNPDRAFWETAEIKDIHNLQHVELTDGLVRRLKHEHRDARYLTITIDDWPCTMTFRGCVPEVWDKVPLQPGLMRDRVSIKHAQSAKRQSSLWGY